MRQHALKQHERKHVEEKPVKARANPREQQTEPKKREIKEKPVKRLKETKKGASPTKRLKVDESEPRITLSQPVLSQNSNSQPYNEPVPLPLKQIKRDLSEDEMLENGSFRQSNS